jgi:hypothetical protein
VSVGARVHAPHTDSPGKAAAQMSRQMLVHKARMRGAWGGRLRAADKGNTTNPLQTNKSRAPKEPFLGHRRHEASHPLVQANNARAKPLLASTSDSKALCDSCGVCAVLCCALTTSLLLLNLPHGEPPAVQHPEVVVGGLITPRGPSPPTDVLTHPTLMQQRP